MTGYVYVVGPASGPYKVGISRSIKSRFATLQNASPTKLFIHRSVKIEDPRDIEQTLHKTLADHRLEGEWFGCSLATIEEAFEALGITTEIHDVEPDLMNPEHLSLPSMTGEDFQDWITNMRRWRWGRSEIQLAALLGVSLDEFYRMKETGASASIGLACRALSHNFTPYKQGLPPELGKHLKVSVYS